MALASYGSTDPDVTTGNLKTDLMRYGNLIKKTCAVSVLTLSILLIHVPLYTQGPNFVPRSAWGSHAPLGWNLSRSKRFQWQGSTILHFTFRAVLDPFLLVSYSLGKVG